MDRVFFPNVVIATIVANILGLLPKTARPKKEYMVDLAERLRLASLGSESCNYHTPPGTFAEILFAKHYPAGQLRVRITEDVFEISLEMSEKLGYPILPILAFGINLDDCTFDKSSAIVNLPLLRTRFDKRVLDAWKLAREIVSKNLPILSALQVSAANETASRYILKALELEK